MASPTKKPVAVPTSVNFATAGLGGLIGWVAIHPFNTLGIRMNLATASGGAAAPQVNFLSFASNIVKREGVLSLYSGLPAGIIRQLFYATSRFGFFEVFRDQLAKYRETDFFSRAVAGVTSGGKIC
jgi:solute carrier family 25 oxoglutarate transporter 11